MIGLLGFLVLFGAGRWLGWAARWVWLAAWGWLLVLLLAHAPYMPPELGAFVGGDLRGWFLLGALAAVIMVYRAGLSRLRRRVAPPAAGAAARPGTFSAVERERYARHILLREIGGPGQKSLKSARVLVVGAGGLGSPALLYLAASGVGVIGVIDDDVVEGSNLQRQIIHADARIGMPKVFSAEIAMKALNPFIEVRPYRRRLDESVVADLVADYDLVLDGTDNFDTRYLVNRVCAAAGKPLIAAAITQWEGQISVYDPARGGPCFECVFPQRPAPGMVPTCAEAGVAAPLPGVIGAMMAMEAIKLLTGAGEGLRGRLVIHDALYAETRVIGVKPRAGCAACGGGG
ncbi:HesA/MoeB/ThiF family protein [Pseudotabrizicola algicola]|uniref:Molybdopterin-synthase adenylyltransferase n=1 Tax=Pseudotabrizicola algicola TaxID=2709381 RepID=A0A6B3RUC7_9RHOB|nr:molybdopterin-synthase adenylyltransferase MoeB [Pseudotabrizicola algicola]NEX47545.1 molybdopterin-synthase adenylyltransferase MoeB [Pseudotabrizicola algicola]